MIIEKLNVRSFIFLGQSTIYLLHPPLIGPVLQKLPYNVLSAYAYSSINFFITLMMFRKNVTATITKLANKTSFKCFNGL